MSAYSALPSRTTADLNSAADVNQLQTNIVCAHGAFVIKTDDYTVTDTDGYGLILVNPSAKKCTILLPTLADNQGRKLTIKVTHRGGDVTVTGEGAETIDGQANFFLNRQYDFIEVYCGNTGWIIKHCHCSYSTGWINTADWTNRHLGSMQITYNAGAGNYIIGELVTEETSNNTWIITANTGTILTLKESTGTGHATNGKHLVGATSGCDRTVNGSTKNIDSHVNHGLAKNLIELNWAYYSSSDGTENNAKSFSFPYYDGTLGTMGIQGWQVDTNNLKIQTANGGFLYLDDGGSYVQIDAEDYYYKSIVTFER